MHIDQILRWEKEGLYCIPGDFYIDSWGPARLNLITHAHSDHARWGAKQHLSTESSLPFILHRLGSDINIQGQPFGEKKKINQTWVSFHPAGHILGSAQIRIESGSHVVVVSGDYKRTPDLSCEPFEVVQCDTFMTESTFALPIYQWPSSDSLAREIYEWWQANAVLGEASILYCYALGKAQRILSLLQPYAQRPIFVHGAIQPYIPVYTARGILLAPTQTVSETPKGHSWGQELILAPPSAAGTPWLRKFAPYATGCASGWMNLRGARRRRGYDRGFVLSDHADWNELMKTIKETGAKHILPVHGNTDVLSHYAVEALNLNTQPLKGVEVLLGEEDATP